MNGNAAILLAFVASLAACSVIIAFIAVHLAYQRLRQFQKLNETLLSASGFEKAAPAFLETLGTFAGVGSAYLFLRRCDAIEEETVHCETFWNSKGQTEAYLLATQQLSCRTGVDIPGRVVETKQAVFVEHLSSEANYPRAATAIACGIKKVMAFPLLVQGDVIGCIEFCAYKPHGVDRNLLDHSCKSFAAFLHRELNRRKAEERDSHLRTVIDSAPDGIILVDERGVIETANRAVSRLLGYEKEDLVGRSILEFLPDTYRSTFSSTVNFYFSAAVQALVGRTAEAVGQRSDGSHFPMEVSVSRLQLGDRQLFTGIIRDISDRKSMERRVSEFYSTISHELRSPLSSIRGSLGLMEGGAMGMLPDEVIELVTIAKRNCDRLIRLINHILDAKKIEAGKLEMRAVPVRPEILIFSAVEGMQSFAAESKISLVAYATDAPMVLADSDRVVQVLTNLLSNAIKYSPPGGQVDIFLDCAINGPDFVRFCVQDRGPGIESNQLSKLFSEFQQVDASDSRPKGGTGLGLAISKNIVEQLGGLIGVDNQPRKGATFWFELPALTEAEHADPTLNAHNSQAMISK